MHLRASLFLQARHRGAAKYSARILASSGSGLDSLAGAKCRTPMTVPVEPTAPDSRGTVDYASDLKVQETVTNRYISGV